MRSKGFTLIELLAVIVILAIIALIATPIILNIIDSTRSQSNESSIELYAKAVENAVAKYYLKNTDNPQGSYEYSEGSQTLIHKTDSTKILDVEYDGAKVECSTIEIYEDGNIFLNNCKVNDADVDYVYGAEKITETSTESSLTIETNKSAPLKNYRIYGNSSGVGDSSADGYVISVTVRGKNLLNPNQQATTIKTYFGIQLTHPNKRYTLKITLKEGKSVPSGKYFGFIHYNDETSTGASAEWLINSNGNFNSQYGDGLTYSFASINTANYYLAMIGCHPGTQTVWDSLIDAFYIQLEEGTQATDYEPYIEPINFNIVLSSPLMENEYIDFKTQSVVRNDGTTESISLPTITPLDVPTTIIEVGTTNIPSKIEVTYFK